jgi:Rne/Rng family ribonuclease
MTEKKGKRRYWRRPPRRKEGEAPGSAQSDRQAGAAGEPPAEGGTPFPGEETPFRKEGGEPPEAAHPEEAPGALTETEALDVAKTVTGDAAPEKGRRRPRRRRGKGGAAAQAGSPPAGALAESDREAGEPGGASIRAEAPAAGDSEFSAESVFGGEGTAEAEGLDEGRTVPGEGGEAQAAETGGEPKKGRRRSRRRGSRRRKGKGVPAAPEGEAAPAVSPATGEIAGGAEGTTSEEYGSAVDPDTWVEPEEEEDKYEEVTGEPGQGPRKTMLIDGIHPEEIRVAFTSDGNLDYFEVENQRKKQFKGNIYKGKVVNVAHAIEAAFVEFGGGRHGFLPLNEYCGGALMDQLGSWNEGDKRPHLRPGTEILVQVTKEESSVKGAAVTSYISIAGRYLVMMLGMKRYGISKKITGEKERERIRKNMEKLTYPEHLGFIVRTVGAGQPLKDLKADLENLLKLWDRTVEGARTQKAPALLYEEQDIVVRTLRDNYASDVAEVLMNSPDSYRKAQAFFDVYYPKQKQKLKLYQQKRPLFSKFNLEEQLEKACARKVALPSGGHIVIDRTEALWSIDVNSGRSSKDRDIEDTAYRTNKEAASEVARQLRIRDMGGLIVVDFIDMENRNHNKDVEKTLKDALKRDKAKSDVSSLGKFGLVGISRQRMGISFYEVLLKECEQCAGTGSLATMDSVMVRLFRQVHNEMSKGLPKDVAVRVSPQLLETLVNQKRDAIALLEKTCGGRIFFVSDLSLPPASFSVGEKAT